MIRESEGGIPVLGTSSAKVASISSVGEDPSTSRSSFITVNVSIFLSPRQALVTAAILERLFNSAHKTWPDRAGFQLLLIPQLRRQLSCVGMWRDSFREETGTIRGGEAHTYSCGAANLNLADHFITRGRVAGWYWREVLQPEPTVRAAKPHHAVLFRRST